MNQGFDSSANPNVFFLDQLSDLPKNINLLQVLGSSVHHTHTQNEHSRLIDKDRPS